MNMPGAQPNGLHPLEFVINGEASVGAWEKPGPLQLHAPNGGNLT